MDLLVTPCQAGHATRLEGHATRPYWPCYQTRLALPPDQIDHTSRPDWPCHQTRLALLPDQTNLPPDQTGPTTRPEWPCYLTTLTCHQTIVKLTTKPDGPCYQTRLALPPDEVTCIHHLNRARSPARPRAPAAKPPIQAPARAPPSRPILCHLTI